jgi:hypothetical protein
MRPVWCFFGGEGGAAVLGLMPSPEPLQIGEHGYVGLLVPSAPVPFAARSSTCRPTGSSLPMAASSG